MSEYDSFNAQALTVRKNNFNGYQFCPRCGVRLRDTRLDGRVRLVCEAASCDFVYYHNPVPAAGVIVYREDRGILLVKRAHPPRINWWCLPAGYMEWDESPARTAMRETFEETGFEVEILGLFNLYSGDDDPRTNAVLALYEARVIGGELTPGDDALDAAFFALDELPERIAFVAHRQALREFAERLQAGDVMSR